jgi:hypothetical protein
MQALLIGSGGCKHALAYEGCKTILCFDITKASGYYSQMAGVLAGFAFAAIILLIQSQPLGQPNQQQRANLQKVLISFITAFLGLVITTFLYAVVSGEEVMAPRAMTLGFVSSIAFSIAVLDLFYGVVWLFKAWDMGDIATTSGRIAGFVLPLIVYTYMGVTALDMLAVAEGKRVTGTWIFWFTIALGPMLFLIVWALWKRLKRLALVLSSDSAFRGTAYISLGLISLAALGTALFSEFDIFLSFPRWVIALLMFIIVIVLVIYIFLIRAIQEGGGEE